MRSWHRITTRLCSVPDLTQWIGIPYDQLTCWELVQAVYLDTYGVDLGPAEKQVEGIRDGEWQPIRLDKEKPMDVLVFHTFNDEPHVGLVLGHGKFLHTQAGVDSCIERYRDLRWKARIRNIYRRSARS